MKGKLRNVTSALNHRNLSVIKIGSKIYIFLCMNALKTMVAAVKKKQKLNKTILVLKLLPQYFDNYLININSNFWLTWYNATIKC